MANDPIIVDDGGSTRIKLLLLAGGSGSMSRLMDVDTLNRPAGRPYVGSQGSQYLKKKNGTGYGSLTLTFIDSAAKAVTLPPIPFTDFQVVSDNHSLRGEVIGAVVPVLDPDMPAPSPGDLLITIHASGVVEPIVDAKQHKKKRRYVVSNAPPIEQVFVNGAAVPIFQTPTSGAGGRPLIPATAGVTLPIIYTTIVVT